MTAQIRVESKTLPPYASQEQVDRAFRSMLSVFKKQVNESGILTEYKNNQAYESKGQKKRRKKRENDLKIRKENKLLKVKLREYFG